MATETRVNPKVQEILTTANPLTIFNLLKMATHFTMVEGGEWFPTKGGDAPVSSHAIRFGNEAVWDCVSGFRDFYIQVEVPDDERSFGEKVGLMYLSPSQHMFDTSEAPALKLHESEVDAHDLEPSDSVDENSSESQPQ